MDSQSYSTADEEEHVEPAVVYQEEGLKFHFYEKNEFIFYLGISQQYRSVQCPYCSQNLLKLNV